MDRVYEAIEALHQVPRRFALAEEVPHVDCEVRRLIMGNFLAFYMIDDEEAPTPLAPSGGSASWRQWFVFLEPFFLANLALLASCCQSAEGVAVFSGISPA